MGDENMSLVDRSAFWIAAAAGLLAVPMMVDMGLSITVLGDTPSLIVAGLFGLSLDCSAAALLIVILQLMVSHCRRVSVMSTVTLAAVPFVVLVVSFLLPVCLSFL
ncbi:MAG: hypothetical protein JSS49_30875 [Planctomycetes bacterium]|nr:hypothetical protein [Planctomycetota bacterium]